jgi:hypothetical protein
MSTITIYLLSWVIPFIIDLLETIPIAVLYYFQGKVIMANNVIVWRIITGPFVHP